MLLPFDRCGGPFGCVAGAAPQKLATLEGLRGILALSVAAHHACCWYYFANTGNWSTGRSVIFDRLADFGVIQFFYLSGFLFWRKLIRRGHVEAGRFYLSRFARIGPVYYVAIAAAILLGFLAADVRLQVAPTSLLTSLLPWFLFSLGGRPAVNGIDLVRITCGVTWTLALEWLFYLSLPFLAWFSRRVWRLGVFGVAFGVLFLAGRHLRFAIADGQPLHGVGEWLAVYAKFMLIGFGGGMLVAALESRLSGWLAPLFRWRNWVVLGLFVAYLTIPGIAALGQILLLAAFALVVEGADLFGFLTRRTTRFLGAISYPVYLVHGMVYFVAMRVLGGGQAFSPVPYIGRVAVCLAAILVVASAVHLLVERPTMKLSERLARGAIAKP